MSKRPTPKKKQEHGRSSRRYKAFQNRSREKLMSMVDAMLKLAKNPRFMKIQEEKANKKSEKITTIKA